MKQKKRSFFYIDGFNFYFSLKGNNWRKYYWIDLEKLASTLIFPGHVLSKVKYFTSAIKKPPEKVTRQQTYLRALRTLKSLEIIFGKYQYNEIECFSCHRKIPVPKEKKTDVNIAVNMILDAVKNNCDVQYLITGDSDLAPAARAVKTLFPKREIFLICPPKPIVLTAGIKPQKSRISKELISISTSHRYIKEDHLKNCLFPDKITNSYGSVIERPVEWQ
jgi:uncharacterized LabA/DUF88 family protein